MISLSKREKLLLQILFVGIAGAIVYYLIILPLVGFAGDTEDELNKNKNDLDRLERLYAEYRDIKQKKSNYTSMLNKKNENTTSLVEQWANSSGIARNIAYTRSKQSSIQKKYTKITTDVKFDGVAIQSFLKFLYDAENSNNLLKVNYLRIHKGLKGTNTYDINLKIDTFISK